MGSSGTCSAALVFAFFVFVDLVTAGGAAAAIEGVSVAAAAVTAGTRVAAAAVAAAAGTRGARAAAEGRAA